MLGEGPTVKRAVTALRWPRSGAWPPGARGPMGPSRQHQQGRDSRQQSRAGQGRAANSKVGTMISSAQPAAVSLEKVSLQHCASQPDPTDLDCCLDQTGTRTWADRPSRPHSQELRHFRFWSIQSLLLFGAERHNVSFTECKCPRCSSQVTRHLLVEQLL